MTNGDLFLLFSLVLLIGLARRMKSIEQALALVRERMGLPSRQSDPIEPSSHVRELALAGEREAAIALLKAEAEIDEARALEVVRALPAMERRGVEGVEIVRARALPTDIVDLLPTAEAEGFGFVARLVRAWEAGENRFDLPGEFFLLAREGERLVGFGGLSVDPFANDSTVGRLRHLYVLPSHRGRGIGREISQRVIAGARGRFAVLRLRTQQAAPFYESLGFVRTSEAEATHRLVLS